ncbi:XF1762 family protein [Leifsonia aquatica]|uniref:XF1762 family protein n=1 Tax=Leifsonia aquatica TaxID=144185 RepID=UPI0035E42EC9
MVIEQQTDRLSVIPVPLAEANEFVEAHHRHHKKVVGHKFSIGVVDESGNLRGVAIVGRPVARRRDDGRTLEVTRLATDGCANAPSALYSAAWRAARAMGYLRIGTYTLASEPGTSLRAAGWRVVHEVRGASWSRTDRPRTDKHPVVDKRLWEPGTPAARSGPPGEGPRGL